MTVARTATCKTLRRNSRLTYQIGTLPVSAIGAVILLYTVPQQTLAMPVVTALAGIGYMYLNHRRKHRAH